MKKIIAGLLAFTLTACTFAGCQKNEQKKSENISANKTDDVTEEKAEAEELSEDGDYETALKEFADAYAENDRQKTLLMQNPKDIMVLVRALVREEGQTEDDIINTMQSDLYETVNSGEKFTFKRIVSAEPLGEDDMEDLKYAFGGRKCAIDYIIRNGGAEKVDLGSLADAIGEIEAETEIYEAGIEEAYYVIYEAENADGDTEEKTVIMFHVKDDGWKAAVAPTESEKLEREDEERGKQLDNIVRAINTAIVEMDEQGKWNSEAAPFVISSDASMGHNIPSDLDRELFMERLTGYTEIPEDMDCFFVIDEYSVVYGCGTYDGDTCYYYPYEDMIPVIDGSGTYNTSEPTVKRSYDELYGYCCELLDK